MRTWYRGIGQAGIGQAGTGPTSRGVPKAGAGAGLSLVEVLVAVAILAMVAGFLMTMRLDAMRSDRAQREHTVLTQVIRSEAELLRAGGGSPGTCTTLGSDLRDAGFTCRVELRCGFSEAMCNAAPGLAGYVIEAATPRGVADAVPLLFRSPAGRSIEAQR